MKSINDVLKFGHKLRSLSNGNKNVVSEHLVKKCQAHITILNTIAEKSNSLIDNKPIQNIKNIYLKFIKISKSDGKFDKEFNKRDLRTLSYALNYREYPNSSIYDDIDYLNNCLNLFDSNWRDLFIPGLLDCYLTNWDNSNKQSFIILSQYITQKINNYQGSRSLYLSLKSNAKFFDKDKGFLELGVTLVILNKKITEVTKFLSLPEDWIKYPYFSKVINIYFEKTKTQIEDKLEDIANVLEKHSNNIKNTRTNKLIVSKIICLTAKSSEIIQNRVKEIAFRLVGDPAYSAIWNPYEGTSIDDTKIILDARNILNEWITRQFINVFFEKCINDPRRKMFWLKYSSKITAFKVFGSKTTRNIIKNDQRIAEYVDGRFQTVESDSSISAFMFLIEKHKLIEFSDPGYAFYAYGANNAYAPSIETKHLHSVDNFRNANLPMLVYRNSNFLYNYSLEGRLAHTDGILTWEEVFSDWLKKIAKVNA